MRDREASEKMALNELHAERGKLSDEIRALCLKHENELKEKINLLEEASEKSNELEHALD